MASDEVRKKWGTIFMGEREASVEQLNAMQEPLRREKQQKEQAEDYMERVRQRAADRAREILGAAYAERQKVLDEARGEAAAIRKSAQAERARLRAEGEAAKKQGQDELAQSVAIREEAEKIRQAAHAEGLESGMQQAATELHEFRAELGNSLGVLMQAIEGQRKAILDYWREELCELTRCAAQAGTGIVLEKEHATVLRSMLYQALDLLENRSSVAVRVNPADEASVSDLFMAARERFPELHQWVVTADPAVSPGGLVAESGTGSVDLRRENFNELVAGVLAHLGLPETAAEGADAANIRALVEKEVASIASMTPEPDKPQPAAEPEIAEIPEQRESAGERDRIPAEEEALPEAVEDAMPETDLDPDAGEPEADDSEPEQTAQAAGQAAASLPEETADPSLAELEEELFPLSEHQAGPEPAGNNEPDPSALAQGGFV